jgi:hypothetical protein
MEQAAVIAHEYMKQLKQERIRAHKEKNECHGKCSGITLVEMFRNPVRQKKTFSKSKKYSYTRLWNYKQVKSW